ncbi:hypothetical protein [Pseudomonas aeruginosa]|uniref:hypothetical protein n=1 Tax=Pseudomonas aeruginosa TaxID=287 RepID=UPI00190FE91B|nr:hypothetical protein [Pseudomonas aeruginosa]
MNKESVEQSGGDERAAFEAWATHLPMDRQPLRPDLYMPQTQWAWEAWQFRAALAQPSQSQYEASFEEWLANELEGEDGQPVPAAVCDIALARRAFNHWPKLEHPAKVGGVRFSAGVSSRLVVEAAQRLYEFESTPEKEAERIERLQAFREQLDPLNLAPHAEAFNEAPADALRPEQAEAERPEVAEVAFVLRNIGAMDAEDIDGDNVDLRFEDAEGRDTGCDVSIVEYAEKAADLFEQHARIVGALRADRDSWAEQAEQRLADWDEMRKERDAALARVAELEAHCVRLGQGGAERYWENRWRDADARLQELEKQEPVAWGAFHFGGKRDGKLYTHCETEAQIEAYILDMHRSSDSLTLSKGPLYAAPVDQAQHSVPEGWKLVPIEPTLEMLDARRDCEDGIDGYLVEDTEYYFPDRGAVRDFLACVYRGMLAAAPGKEVGHE